MHEELPTIDERINRFSHRWRVERMPAVDRNVLRMALWEMLPGSATPAAVVMNEAIEIVRRFSTGEAGSFVNGILDRAEKVQSKQ